MATTESEMAAFDIDGVLTTNEGMNEYMRLKSRDGLSVGVITARSEMSALRFIDKKNIRPDFVETGQLKGRIMSDLGVGTYYGSWFRDKVHASLAGWEYIQL